LIFIKDKCSIIEYLNNAENDNGGIVYNCCEDGTFDISKLPGLLNGVSDNLFLEITFSVLEHIDYIKIPHTLSVIIFDDMIKISIEMINNSRDYKDDIDRITRFILMSHAVVSDMNLNEKYNHLLKDINNYLNLDVLSTLVMEYYF